MRWDGKSPYALSEGAAMFAPKVAKTQTKAATTSMNSLARHGSALMAHRPGHGATAQVVMLQRMVGNQALLRFFAHWAGPPPDKGHSDQHEQETQGRTWQASGASLDFSKMRTFPPDQVVQSNSRPSAVSRSATEVRAMPAVAHDSANNPEGQEVAPPIVHAVLRSSGEPLEVGARTLFESRFARDFGHVRVHR